MLDPRQGIACVVGTRPEVVKTAPVLAALRGYGPLRVRLVATGQHRDLLDRALADFDLEADVDLAIMRPDQSPAEVAARGLEALSGHFRDDPPGLVLAQGDTTTVLCAALAAFYARTPFAHVEAGLRTGNPDRPFPEEVQRALVARLARFNFAPTSAARENLLREGIDPATILVTGNTVVDALRLFAPAPSAASGESGRTILVTAHRRENLGGPLLRICAAVGRILDDRPDVRVVWPLHPNPHVGGVVRSILGGRPRVALTDPMSYRDFLGAMAGATLVLTDSGGVQEEAPSFGKPVVVLREETERGEFVGAGAAVVAGSDPDRIVSAALAILDGGPPASAASGSPVGDGFAAVRIARRILIEFGIAPRDVEGISEEWGR